MVLGFSRTRTTKGFPGGSDINESACSVGVLGSIPGLGRSPGGGHGNPVQYSCLENPHGERSLAGCSPDTTEQPSTGLQSPRGPQSRAHRLNHATGRYTLRRAPTEGQPFRMVCVRNHPKYLKSQNYKKYTRIQIYLLKYSYEKLVIKILNIYMSQKHKTNKLSS